MNQVRYFCYSVMNNLDYIENPAFQFQPNVEDSLLGYTQQNQFRVRTLYHFVAEMDEEVTIEPGIFNFHGGAHILYSVRRNNYGRWNC